MSGSSAKAVEVDGVNTGVRPVRRSAPRRRSPYAPFSCSSRWKGGTAAAVRSTGPPIPMADSAATAITSNDLNDREKVANTAWP